MTRRLNFLTFFFCLYAATTLVSMAAMNIGKVLLMAAVPLCLGFRPFWNGLKEELASPAIRVFFRLTVLLFLACMVSMVYGIINPLTYAGQPIVIDFFKSMAKLHYLFLPFLMVVGLRSLSEKQIQILVRVSIYFALVLSIFGVIQVFYGWPRYQLVPDFDKIKAPNAWFGFHIYHATLFLGHHLTVASVFCFPFFVMLELFVRKNREQRYGLNRWLLIAGALFSAATLVFTFSRMLWLGIPIALFFWMNLHLSKKRRWISFITIAVFLAVFGFNRAVQHRLSFASGMLERFQLWEANLDFFAHRPLVGAGWKGTEGLSHYYILEKYPKSTEIFSGHAHNNIIEMMGGTGLIGTTLFILWNGWIFLWLFRLYKRDPMNGFPGGLLSAWLFFHLNGLTQVNFWDSKSIQQVVWVAAWTMFWTRKK